MEEEEEEWNIILFLTTFMMRECKPSFARFYKAKIHLILYDFVFYVVLFGMQIVWVYYTHTSHIHTYLNHKIIITYFIALR